MDTLIALNLGWGANFRILLDGDVEGDEAETRYRDRYSLSDEYFVRLEKGERIEDLFSDGEIRTLAEIANLELQPGRISKKEFAAVFATLRFLVGERAVEIRNALLKKTKLRLESLLTELILP
ncbi:MAG: hypothetical protein ABI451_05860 [Dokdonella sp.]